MPNERLPGPLREVAEQLAKLPGLGPKSALRASLALLKMPREQAEAVGRGILTLRERLCMCQTCGSLAESDPCHICADPGRTREQLCLVAEWDSLLALEEMVLQGYPGIVISRLAQGIPMGAEVKYMDRETLRQSLTHRQAV